MVAIRPDLHCANQSTCKSSPVKSVATAEHACPTSIPLHPIAWPALWASLPNQTTWHACLSVGMLTHLSLHHMACLPDLWACLPIQHSIIWTHPILRHMALPDLWACPTQPALHHMACLPNLWACLSIQHLSLYSCLKPTIMLTHSVDEHPGMLASYMRAPLSDW